MRIDAHSMRIGRCIRMANPILDTSDGYNLLKGKERVQKNGPKSERGCKCKSKLFGALHMATSFGGNVVHGGDMFFHLQFQNRTPLTATFSISRLSDSNLSIVADRLPVQFWQLCSYTSVLWCCWKENTFIFYWKHTFYRHALEIVFSQCSIECIVTSL